MKDDELAAVLTRLYPCFQHGPPPDWLDDLAALPEPMSVPAGTTLFEEGSLCQGFPLLLEGNVRVSTGSRGGRQLVLYQVRAGEVCVVSATCLFAAMPMAGRGVTTAATRLLSLPAEVFLRWTGSEAFRRFVFAVFATRMVELAQLAEAVAFQRLDQRLAAALLAHGGPVRRTHQALADELGTVREMVTRLLQRFEHSGWIALGRGQIHICDAAALSSVACGYSP